MSTQKKPSPHQTSIAIIGGGMMGISSALGLAEVNKFSVTLYEKETSLGGLSSFFSWEDVSWDRFYHVILSTDNQLLEFLKNLGLLSQLFWTETKSGFYGDNRLVSFSSVSDFIQFPFLSFPQKIRLAAGILYSSRLKNTSRLDRIYVRKWLTSIFGRRIYENIWDPLLRSKMGSAREKTSASFIQATIKRLYGARSSGSKIEQMGHVEGGYQSILEASYKKLNEQHVDVRTGSAVVEIIPSTKSGRHSFTVVTESGNSDEFDQMLLTIPCPEIIEILKVDKTDPYWKRMSDIEYLNVICVLNIVRTSLSPYYVISLLDGSLPFTGIIEATNIVSPKALGGKHLVYLPKYLTADDPTHSMSDGDIRESFSGGLMRVFPQLRQDDILHQAVFREKYVQPLQVLYYVENITEYRTPLPSLYVANTSMIKNTTLNNNAVIAISESVVENINKDLISS